MNSKIYYDVSIHFTIKDQSIESISQKLNRFIDDNAKQLQFDFSYRTEPRTVLHHCFLPEKIVVEKGFSNEIYEAILEPLAEDKICWHGVSGDLGLVWDRQYMLENIKKLNGLALFIGDIKEGVKDEFDICQELGIHVIKIP